MGLFQKAMPCDLWLKILIDGVSGGGKSTTALRLATGMAEIVGSRVAMISSGGESKKLDWLIRNYDFDVVALSNCSILNYIKMIETALKEGYKVIILDSYSDAYDGENGYLQQAENIGRDPKQSGLNKWRIPTEHWNKLSKLITNCNAHVFCTVKSKTKHVQENLLQENGRLKYSIKRVGESPVIKERTEYEFDFYMSMDENHVATFNTSRHDKYNRMIVEYPDEAFGKQLLKDSNNLQQTFAIKKEARIKVLNEDGLVEDVVDAPEIELTGNSHNKYNVDMKLDETPEPVADALVSAPVQSKPANTIPIKKPTVTYLSKEESDELIAIATETGYKREQIKAVLNKHGIVYLSKIPVDTKLILERIFKDKGYLIGM